MSAQVRQLLDELRGTKCRCGSEKRSRETFCKCCYYTLPAEMRRALYRRFDEGYEQAYAAAAKVLVSRG